MGAILLGRWYDVRDLSNAAAKIRDLIDQNAISWPLIAFIGAFLIFNLVAGAAIFDIWLERRAVGRMQVRLGPNRLGPFGLLQPIADLLKLIQKEAMRPLTGDRFVFAVAPIAVYVPALLTWAVFPFGQDMVLANLNIGVLYVLGISSVTVIAVFMAGWGSNNKFALLGSMRAIAMLVSYEIPAVLALLGVVLWAGTMNITDIVLWQRDYHVWLVVLQPLALLTYILASSAELNRTPSDIAEAESEIVAGYHTEYSGMQFGLFYAVELVNAMAVSALIGTLFFGGWWLFGLERWIPGWIIFIGKMYVFYFLFIWLRGTLPRFRIDQLMGFAWKFLLPLNVVNIFAVALEILLWQEYSLSAGVVLPVSAAVNIALTGVLVVGWSRLLSFSFERLPKRPRLYADIDVPSLPAPPTGAMEQRAAAPGA